MWRPRIWLLHCVVALRAAAQQSTDSSSSSTGSTASSTSSSSSSTQSSSEGSSFTYTNSFSLIESTVPESFTGSQYTYATYNGQSEVNATSTLSSDITGISGSQSVQTTHHQNVTQITAERSHTASSTTSSAPLATNTVPCNNYPEFCSRKYSNITEVCAHNSAFSIKDNAASNQRLSIVDQLDDGVRMSMLAQLASRHKILTCSSPRRSALGQQHHVFLPHLMRPSKRRHLPIRARNRRQLAERPPLRRSHHSNRQLRPNHSRQLRPCHRELRPLRIPLHTKIRPAAQRPMADP